MSLKLIFGFQIVQYMHMDVTEAPISKIGKECIIQFCVRQKQKLYKHLTESIAVIWQLKVFIRTPQNSRYWLKKTKIIF